MKPLIILGLLVLCGMTNRVQAQIHQAGQSSVELSAGLVDGVKLPGKDNFGFFTTLAYSHYRSRYTYWKAGIHLNQKYYAYDKSLVPLSQWLGEATLFTRAIGLVGNSWVLNIGGGVAGGYESLNQDSQTVEGAVLMNQSNWSVGPTVAVELEYILSSRTMLVVRAQEYYLFRSSVTPTRFNVGFGLKFTLPTDTE